MRFTTHWSILLFVVVCITYLTRMKGWAVFFAFPLLLVVVPILIVTRYMVRSLLVPGVTRPSLRLIFNLQLIAVLAFYFFLPSFGDGRTLGVFGNLMEVERSSAFVNLSYELCMIVAFVFLASTVAIFVSYFKKLMSKTG